MEIYQNLNKPLRLLFKTNYKTPAVTVDGMLYQDPNTLRVWLLTKQPYFGPNGMDTYNPHQDEYPNGFYLGGAKVLNRDCLGTTFFKVEIVTMKAMFKTDSQGNLFRRIIKEEGNLIALGPIKKDLDATKKPASNVFWTEKNWLQENGWQVYETEPSVDEKITARPKINL